MEWRGKPVYRIYTDKVTVVGGGPLIQSEAEALQLADLYERDGHTVAVTVKTELERPAKLEWARWNVRLEYVNGNTISETAVLEAGQTLGNYMDDRIRRSKVPVASYSASLCKQV